MLEEKLEKEHSNLQLHVNRLLYQAVLYDFKQKKKGHKIDPDEVICQNQPK